jgi:DNA-binding CsgD family transcriptional regulator
MLFGITVETDHKYHSIIRATTRFALTNRQSEVLSLILDGANASEIARLLSITENTAQGYMKSLLDKTNCRNRAAMIAKILDWKRSAAFEPLGARRVRVS